jgi:hypothetical protein
LDRRFQTRYQAASAAVGAVLGFACGIWALRAGHGSALEDIPYLIAITITGIFGASTVYWLWGGLTFLHQLSRFRSVELPLDPGGNPLIRGIYQLVAHARIRVGIGLLLSELPLLVLDHSAPRSAFLVAATLAVFAVCFSTLAAISFAPDFYVGRICRTSQDREIAMLTDRRTHLIGLEEREAFRADCDLLQTVAAIRSRPVRKLTTAGVVSILSAVVPALLPFALLLLAHSGASWLF